MHPVSTALFILGYALSLPIGSRMAAIVTQQHRLGFVGHQLGVGIALLGWLIRGNVVITLIHVMWLIGVRLWFHHGRPDESAGQRSASA